MKYFAYGMNTNLDGMAARCPGATSLGCGWVSDHKFVFRHYADIEKSPGDVCYGVLWDIDQKHLRSLDALEGFPHYYSRRRVRVNFEHGFVYAVTYYMNDQTTISAPAVGYLNMVTQGYQQNNVPDDQIDHAINMICCLPIETNMEYLFTQSQTIKAFA